MSEDINLIVGKSYKYLRERVLPAFISENQEDIAKVVTRCPMYVVFKSGITTYFVSEQQYPIWCKGRTYYMYGVKYHSGYKIGD